MSQNSTRTPQRASRTSTIVTIILSVLLAFGLWLYVVVAESPTGQRTFNSVPVKLSGTDTLSGTYGFSVLTGYDVTMEVTLRGRQSELNALNDEDITAKVDLSDITAAGSYQKKIHVTPPNGTEVVHTSPSDLVVEVDVEKTVSVPVSEPEATYSLSGNQKLSCNWTKSISVKGPQSVVDKIARIKCQVSDLGELTESCTKEVSYQFVDKDGNEIANRYLVPARNTVTVVYELYEEKTKTVPLVIHVSTLLSDESVTSNITPAQITVRGSAEVIDGLDEIVVQQVSTADFDKETVRYSGNVPLPEGVVSTEGDVAYQAEVSLSGVATTRVSLDLEGDNVVITEPADMHYSFATRTIGVNVRASELALARVDANSLLASVNLSSYQESGTYTTNVTLSVREEDRDICYVIGSATVDVVVWR